MASIPEKTVFTSPISNLPQRPTPAPNYTWQNLLTDMQKSSDELKTTQDGVIDFLNQEFAIPAPDVASKAIAAYDGTNPAFVSHLADNVNIRQYPRIGAETNDNARIKRALDFLVSRGGGILHFNADIYSIKGDDSRYITGQQLHDANYSFLGGIDIPDNIVILGIPGKTIFNILPNASDCYVCFHIFNRENITISGINIVGDKDTHIGTTGEYGHGITIFNSKNVILKDINISKTWGDGLYIGIKYNNTTSKQSENIYISNINTDYTSRNGISLGSGKNIKIINCSLKNSNRTLPKAGMDIEPEGSGTSGVVMEGITIDNLITELCLYGIDCYMDDSGYATDLLVDVTINNHKDFGSTIGDLFQRGSNTKKITGMIKCNNCTNIRNQNNGISIYNWAKSRSPLLEISYPVILENNQAGSTVYNYQGFTERASISIISDLASTEDVGGIIIKEPSIIDNRTTLGIWPAILVNGSSTSKINGIDIIDPLKINVNNNMYTFIQNTNQLNLVDKYRQMITNVDYYTFTINTYASSIFDDVNVTTYYTVVLANDVEDGREITFIQNKTRFDIDLRNGGTPINIYPLTSSNNYLRGSAKGGKLKIKKINGEWFAQEIIGTWTAVNS